MKIFVTGDKSEIIVAILCFGEAFTDNVFGIVDGVGSLSADVDLLNLN